MSDQACAHLHVSYMSVIDWKGITHGWWQCDLCRVPFAPEAELARLREQLDFHVDVVKQYQQEVVSLQELVEQQRAALLEIAKREGLFKRDQYEFATSVIDNMRSIADAALDQPEEQQP